MTNTPPPMTRTELFELAALDAFGLLDEYESMLYTRSFHHATAAVQDEIVNLQAEIVSDESLLPHVSAPPELREKVLQRVANAIEESVSELAPIATIGRRTGAVSPHTAAPSMLIRGGSTPYWRAAVFALAATTLVVAYFWNDANQHNNKIARYALDNITGAQIEQLIGPTYKEFLFDPMVRRIVFTADDADSSAKAVVLLREDGQAFVVMAGLPNHEDAVCSITVREGDGPAITLDTFNSRGKLVGHKIDATQFASATNLTWEITGPEGVILRSA